MAVYMAKENRGKMGEEMDKIPNVIETNFTLHNESVNNAIVIEIQRISVKIGLETMLYLNEREIISALEKQIPEKVRISLKGTTDWNTKCYCPVCRENLYGGQKYCGHCGQRLDWGVTDE